MIARLWCQLWTRHADNVIARVDGRMVLRRLRCGHQSRGWECGGAGRQGSQVALSAVPRVDTRPDRTGVYVMQGGRRG